MLRALTARDYQQLQVGGVDDANDSPAAADVSVQPVADHPSAPPLIEDHPTECVRAMLGLRYSTHRELLYWLLALCIGSLSCLFAHWFPLWSLPRRYQRCPLSAAHFVLVVAVSGRPHFCPVEPVTSHPSSQLSVFIGRYHSAPPASLLMERSPLRAQPRSSVAAAMELGQSSATAATALALHGPNTIDIAIPSIPVLLVTEILHPFFVFQLYSVILWSTFEYYYFAACIVIIAIAAIVTTLMETRKRLFALREMAAFTSTVTVKRDGRWSAAPSSTLVPGDVVQLTNGVIPCDLALLSGGCVVNESRLTGESLPVLRSAVDMANYSPSALVDFTSTSHTLFSATYSLQLKPISTETPVMGMVLRTGWSTSKGSLILSILYPTPTSFRFVEQSYRFIAVLAVICTLGFIISVFRMVSLGTPPSVIATRALALITIIVQPTLPLALSVGVNYALSALRQKGVHCISPAKINVAGKVRVICFDKTGTLTSDGMDMKGVRPVHNGHFIDFIDSSQQAGQLQAEEKQMDVDTHLSTPISSSSPASSSSFPQSVLRMALSSCHSLTVVDGALVGDPLEVQIFRSTKATLVELASSAESSTTIRLPPSSPTSPAVEVRVLQQFAYQPALQRMTVVCLTPGGSHLVFTKGAPEVVESLCISTSVPSSFGDTTASYARQGYRVLAIAYRRTADPSTTNRNDGSDVRTSLESELTLLGLIILENPLKPETAPTLAVAPSSEDSMSDAHWGP